MTMIRKLNTDNGLQGQTNEHQAVTGGCCQWRDSASYDSEVVNEPFVLRRKFSGKIATVQQPPNRWLQCYYDYITTFKLKKMTEAEYLKHIEDSINEIESIDFRNNWSYEKVIHSILKIQKLPIILFNEPKGNFIFRSRINDGVKPFVYVSKISIPDEKFVQNYARANKPKQSLFYGSENRITSYMEFAMYLAECTPFNEEVSITIGIWEIQRDLTFALVFNPEISRDTKYNKYHGEAFDDFIRKTPEELRKGTLKFFKFIGEKYAELADKNTNNYLITCAYSNIIFAYEQCEGIMYPSVPSGGDAFNVVIKKNAINEDVLKLKEVKMDKFIAREQPNGKHDFVNNASMDASNIANDKIEWNSSWQQWL